MVLLRHLRFWLLALAGIGASCAPKTDALDPAPPPGPRFVIGNDLESRPRPPRGMRRVEQFEGDTLLSAVEYDREGRVVFGYAKQDVHTSWPGRYLTFIGVNHYASDRLMGRYDLHSNAGATVTAYRHSGWGRTVREYVRRTSDEDLYAHVNDNAFRFISRLRTPHAVLQHPVVGAWLPPDPAVLAVERTYGLGGRLHQVRYFDARGREESRRAYAYNAAGQLATDVVTRGGQRDQRTTYAYDAHGRLVKALTLGARSDTAGLRHYRYNTQGALAEGFLFQGHDASPLALLNREAHFFTSRFGYAPNGQLRRVTTADVYVAATCGLDCPIWREEHGKQTVFRYNPEGYVAEEETTVLRDQEVSRKRYRYAYQFWQVP